MTETETNMSVILGKTLVYGPPILLRVWLESAEYLVDAAVFLVRSGLGSPAFVRVCTEADMHNYPDAEDTEPGWYRVPGMEFELLTSEAMGRALEQIQRGMDALDAEVEVSASASAEASTTITVPLRYCRTGDVIGNMVVVKIDTGDSFAYTISVTYTDTRLQTLLTESVFRVTSADFREFLGVVAPADIADSASASADTEDVPEVTVYLNKDKPGIEGLMFGALSADIEDLCSFILVEEST